MTRRTIKRKLLALLGDRVLPDLRKPSALNGSPLKCQINSKFVQLPNELLLPILGELGTTELASLIQTCRYFRELLEPMVYRHLKFGSTTQSDAALRTLAKRPDLVPYVESYNGPLCVTVSEGWFGLGIVHRSFRSRIRKTKGYKNKIKFFTQAYNLRDLRTNDWPAWADELVWSEVVDAVSKIPLKRLSYRSRPWDDSVCQLLQAQPDLEVLMIDGDEENLKRLDKAALPKLRYLITSLPVASVLVPGRPVERLQLSINDLDSHTDAVGFQRLSQSSRKIRSLCVWFSDYYGGLRLWWILKAIGKNLPDVEQLTLVHGGVVSAQRILEWFPPLKSLRQLNLLSFNLASSKERLSVGTEVSYEDTSTYPPRSEEEQWNDIFDVFKKRCPSLVECP
ncbi:hypothetical protein FRB90_009714 [Tulasnella sp. 427]|nr:hypothetical protein FRB90_009714 [Tulasnella sp. 427]